MGLTNSGPLSAFQNIKLTGQGTASLSATIDAALGEVFGVLQADGVTRSGGGADFEASILGELNDLIVTTFADIGYQPNGTHLIGRNVETEIISGIAKLNLFLADEGQDASLRAAIIPEIARQELLLANRDFMKPLRDPEWGGDMLEFIIRCAPHMVITGETAEGLLVPQLVAIDFSTLSADVDRNGEITTWMYSEPLIS